MRTALLSCLLLILPACAQAADPQVSDPPVVDPQVAEPQLVPIFNGTDLSGFRVPHPNPNWTVQGGVLVGLSDPAKKGSMLRTEKQYQDVIVEVEFRFTGEIDSGVMLRKPEIQAQIGVSRSLKKDMTASIYARKIPQAGRRCRHPSENRRVEHTPFPSPGFDVRHLAQRPARFELSGSGLSPSCTDRVANPPWRGDEDRIPQS